MADFNIKKGLKANLFDSNKNLLITPEEGTWYITTDTFELYGYFNGVFSAIGAINEFETRLTTIENEIKGETGLKTQVSTIESTLTTEINDRIVMGDTLDAKISEALAAAKQYADDNDNDTIYDDSEIKSIIAQKANLTDVYNKDVIDTKFEDVNQAIADITHFSVELVESTEQMTESGVLYLVQDENGIGIDKFNEYLVIGGIPTLIGDTSTDLTNYVTKTQLEALENDILISYATKEELNNKVDKTILDNYYTKEVIDNRGYAIASDVITALGTKVDKGSISHTDESNAEGVIVEGTELKIIVDAYTKAETLNKIQEKIIEINGGESAGEVLSQLNSYIETNNTRVGNIEAKNTLQDEAITNAINLVTELENGTVASNTKDINTIKESLSILETVTNDHKTRIKTLEDTFTTLDSVVKDHSTSIGEITAWIEEAEAETAAINEAIADMSTVLTGFGGEGEPATIKEYIDANQYTLGVASETSLGGIKAAPATMDNGVQVSTEGIATVGRVNVNSLVQTEGEYFILEGGRA